MTDEIRQNLAARVDEAARAGTTIPQLTIEYPDFSVDDAYDVQRLSIARRFARGEERVGMKMGLTSRAKMEQVGVHEPIYGHLSNGMRVADGGTIEMTGRCHPRAEPEVAFIIESDVAGVMSAAEVAPSVRGVCAALEIIDSRYENFSFALPDVVADNTSASGFILGSELRRLDELDLGNLGIVFEQNGDVVGTGSSAAILEHPINALLELLAMLDRRGEGLRAGDVVLAGAATAATHLASGDTIRATVDGLGSVGFFVA